MQKVRVIGAPLSIQLLVTRECNLKCNYCSAAQFNDLEQEEELSTFEWMDFLKKLKNMMVFNIIFSGGEPLLRLDFLSILAKAKELKFPSISINSNGILINDEIAENLKKLNISDIAVSMDGNEKAHDDLRGNGSFNKVLAGIEKLIKRDIIPTIAFTPLKTNYRTLHEMLSILQKLSIKKIFFNSLHPTGRSKDKYLDLILDPIVEIGEFEDIVKQCKSEFKEILMPDANTFYKNVPKMYQEKKHTVKTAQRLKQCSPAHSSCSITSSGWVLPCSELFDFRGGNIRNQDFLEIWKNSKEFKEIRNLSELTTAQIPYCRYCQFNVLCHAGCRADAYAILQDLLAPDPYCPYWRKK